MVLEYRALYPMAVLETPAASVAGEIANPEPGPMLAQVITVVVSLNPLPPFVPLAAVTNVQAVTIPPATVISTDGYVIAVEPET